MQTPKLKRECLTACPFALCGCPSANLQAFSSLDLARLESLLPDVLPQAQLVQGQAMDERSSQARFRHGSARSQHSCVCCRKSLSIRDILWKLNFCYRTNLQCWYDDVTESKAVNDKADPPEVTARNQFAATFYPVLIELLTDGRSQCTPSLMRDVRGIV